MDALQSSVQHNSQSYLLPPPALLLVRRLLIVIAAYFLAVLEVFLVPAGVLEREAAAEVVADFRFFAGGAADPASLAASPLFAFSPAAGAAAGAAPAAAGALPFRFLAGSAAASSGACSFCRSEIKVVHRRPISMGERDLMNQLNLNPGHSKISFLIRS